MADTKKDKLPEITKSESEYLSDQASAAQAAISQKLTAIKKDLAQTADPRVWARAHPWPAIGVAAVAGLVAGLAAIPSKEEQALKKLAEFERMVMRGPSGEAAESAAADEAAASSPQAPSLFRTLLHELVSLAKPIITSAITAKVATGDGTHNGHGTAAAPNP